MTRLIDADAVEKITWEEPHYQDPLNVLTEVREKVRALPTVDAIPVRHGKWIEDIDPEEDCWKEEVVYCSCCKEPIRVSEADNTYFLPTVKTLKYCPNCGARMDGE